MTRQPSWEEIEALFFAALEIPTSERDAWIGMSAETPELASEVRSLIQAHEMAVTQELAPLVGPYRLERLLGLGGMGEVWLASRADGHFQQQVALKLVRPGLGAETLLPRFRQERQLMAGLNHPNITRLLDGGISADGRPYLAMEYVDGEPLLEYCENRRLSLRQRLELFVRLCSAAEYAHQHLIVHRDIKPGNVLVTSDGTPKLLDFGVAKLLEADSTATTATLPLLTPRYASPEQLRGEPASTASDVYSLGVLLFEMLTGTLPYVISGRGVPEIIAAVTTQEAMRPSQVQPSAVPVPAGDLDAIAAKALEKDPRRRYGSVERLSADIRNYLDGMPVSARPLTAAYRLQKFVRRHWIGAAAIAAVVLALAAAAGVSAYAARTANQQRARAERVTSFLENVLGSANPFSWDQANWANGSGMKLADLLPIASQRIGEQFAEDPAAQAQLHSLLAESYTRMNEYMAAEKEVKLAVEHLGSLNNDPVAKSKVLYVAGLLDFRLSHYDAEEREMREAVAIVERTPSLRADLWTRAAYLVTLAVVLADCRKKGEALEVAGKAEDLMKGMAGRLDLQAGMLQGGLALLYQKAGHLTRGAAAARDAVKKLSSAPRPLPALADAEETLGQLERLLGDSSAARAAFDAGLQTYIRALGPGDPLAIQARTQVAYQRALDGQPTAALPELYRCLAEARPRSNPEDLFFALQYTGYALVLAGQPKQAEPLLREAVRVGHGFLSPAGPSMGICDMQLGECLERQGHSAEALPLYQTAFQNLKSYYGSDVYITRQALLKLEHAQQRTRSAASR